jgi:hypothetical protein
VISRLLVLLCFSLDTCVLSCCLQFSRSSGVGNTPDDPKSRVYIGVPVEMVVCRIYCCYKRLSFKNLMHKKTEHKVEDPRLMSSRPLWHLGITASGPMSDGRSD